ncbi:hypothetical protein [Ralstonia phage RSP15]|uniref:DNA repair protein n=1 Tax=Ralstonia phage RSP15 TaxID=1785960 RepID=UPI00074D372F|nr:DNA repair protein [Ralstonia phage RSP15]BAU40128.1 hypothetical protein [Ralstonia phage RSP15]
MKAVSNPNIAILEDSIFKEKKANYSTPVPMINGMMSADTMGGINPGVTIVMGDSRTFKTNFCVLNAKAFQDQHEDGYVVFFDCEFGAANSFKTFGIDESRVIHVPFTTIEQMKIEVSQMLDALEEGEKIFILIDSVSQVASKKEVNDAVEGKDVSDMTRAKSLNSFWRIVTPILTIKNIPLFAINSFYADTTNKYAENIMKGGKQGFLSADTILMVTRSQEKDDKAKDEKLKGWSFNYTVMKSRFVKEKSKFSLLVTYAGGIDLNSGLFDLAMNSGLITMPKSGWYKIDEDCLKEVDPSLDADKLWRKAEIEESGFLMKLAKNKTFRESFRSRYAIEAGAMYSEEDEDGSLDVVIDPDTGEIIDVA